MMEMWAVEYTDHGGRRRVKVFDTEAAARAFANHPVDGIKITSKPWDLFG